MAEVHTSDGKERANSRTITLPPIPYKIDGNARVGVLYTIGNTLKTAGASINPISPYAAYDQNTITQRVNDIINAVNAEGATPPLKTYLSIDYNSFNSVIKMIVAGIATIP